MGETSRAVTRGSRLFNTISGLNRCRKNITRSFRYDPKRLPSKLPFVASFASSARGSSETTSARTIWQLASGCHVGLHHFGRVDHPIELLFGYEAELQCRLLQSEIMIHGIVRNLRGFIVADDRSKRSHQHQ
jgi:hypothetical protein